jgi:hypothetical protein
MPDSRARRSVSIVGRNINCRNKNGLFSSHSGPIFGQNPSPQEKPRREDNSRQRSWENESVLVRYRVAMNRA